MFPVHPVAHVLCSATKGQSPPGFLGVLSEISSSPVAAPLPEETSGLQVVRADIPSSPTQQLGF